MLNYQRVLTFTTIKEANITGPAVARRANASVSVDAPHIIGLRRESVRGPGGSWHNVGPSDCYVDYSHELIVT